MPHGHENRKGSPYPENLSALVLKADLGPWYDHLVDLGYSPEEIRDACQLRLDRQLIGDFLGILQEEGKIPPPSSLSTSS